MAENQKSVTSSASFTQAGDGDLLCTGELLDRELEWEEQAMGISLAWKIREPESDQQVLADRKARWELDL